MDHDFFDTIRAYLKQHPKVLGLVPFTLALMLLVGAWKNWNWLYEGGPHGLGAISAYLGRSTARIASVLMALVLMGCAIFMFCCDTW